VERLLEWPSEQGFSGTRKEIIAWWEARRFRFNLYLGIVGAIAWFLVLIVGSAAVKPGTDFEEPVAMLIGPFIYGFLANICYTIGWNGFLSRRHFLCGPHRLARGLGCCGMAHDCHHRPQTWLIPAVTEQNLVAPKCGRTLGCITFPLLIAYPVKKAPGIGIGWGKVIHLRPVHYFSAVRFCLSRGVAPRGAHE
jgi:hypothetical protein